MYTKLLKNSRVFLLAISALTLTGCISSEMDCDTEENIGKIQSGIDARMNQARTRMVQRLAYGNPQGFMEIPSFTVESSQEVDKNSKGMRTCKVKMVGDHGDGNVREYYLTYLIKNSRDPNETHYIEVTSESDRAFLNKLQLNMESIVENKLKKQQEEAEAMRKEVLKKQAAEAGFISVEDYELYLALNESQKKIEKELAELAEIKLQTEDLLAEQMTVNAKIKKEIARIKSLVREYDKKVVSGISFGVSNDVIHISNPSLTYSKTKAGTIYTHLDVTIKNASDKTLKEAKINFELYLNGSRKLYAASWTDYRKDDKGASMVTAEFPRKGLAPGEIVKTRLYVSRGQGGQAFRSGKARDAHSRQVILFAQEARTTDYDHIGTAGKNPSDLLKGVQVMMKNGTEYIDLINQDVERKKSRKDKLQALKKSNEDKLGKLKKNT